MREPREGRFEHATPNRRLVSPMWTEWMSFQPTLGNPLKLSSPGFPSLEVVVVMPRALWVPDSSEGAANRSIRRHTFLQVSAQDPGRDVGCERVCCGCRSKNIHHRQSQRFSHRSLPQIILNSPSILPCGWQMPLDLGCTFQIDT
jgi:hypothetical protein